MAVDHVQKGLVSIGTAILADIDEAASAGYIKLQNSAQTATYATLTFAVTSGTVNSTTGVLTFDCTSLSETNCPASGTAVKAGFYSGGGVEVMNCSVGTTGADINLSSNVFNIGDTVQITSLTYTPPA